MVCSTITNGTWIFCFNLFQSIKLVIPSFVWPVIREFKNRSLGKTTYSDTGINMMENKFIKTRKLFWFAYMSIYKFKWPIWYANINYTRVTSLTWEKHQLWKDYLWNTFVNALYSVRVLYIRPFAIIRWYCILCSQ